MLKSNKGFTLLEALLAMGILSIVTVQIINVQSSSVAVTSTTKNVTRATWAMRSAVSQLQYVLDAYGVEGLPKETAYNWPVDENFKVTVLTKETIIEASKLLSTVMKLGSAGGKSEESDTAKKEEDPTKGMKEIGEILDGQIPKDMYRSVKLLVTWKDGETDKSIEGGMLVIDDAIIKLNVPGLDSLGGIAPPDGGGAPQGGAAPSGGAP